jgi:hypothetical protein
MNPKKLSLGKILAKSTTTPIFSGWLDFKPLKGGEKSKGTSVPVALPQGTTTRGSGFLEDNKCLIVCS